MCRPSPGMNWVTWTYPSALATATLLYLALASFASASCCCRTFASACVVGPAVPCEGPPHPAGPASPPPPPPGHGGGVRRRIVRVGGRGRRREGLPILSSLAPSYERAHGDGRRQQQHQPRGDHRRPFGPGPAGPPEPP